MKKLKWNKWQGL